uniref:Uncharacterized protein n=1 Tax=Geospiza parvula TaxID=87175 RepID=A0A8U8BDX0_GEOPR
MAAMSSLEAVRRKIRSLQEQADAAEERAGRLQREVDQERALREEGKGTVGLVLGRGRIRCEQHRLTQQRDVIMGGNHNKKT